ncbi:histidine phosphatase family protein [Apilactobacillus xinyiensis]|uniref:Histidine phosphatase family protein n=1 Tax=Apilactobacillus xinyiensis TaxID=2841032 RepID=A0ABT0I1Z3_9LACO|nr:histidine phosphatase family protein [Apilactobacillus xinyiensis]MCK8624736.1 histidine phosphatase family protein [Apilactobacillus xinyiensis]MCL0312403.1 histidine phosphatase family protein [Apilactobacillus xinyiensis]MCL0318851.1 histidine phosphatase family protein [Apilactobacillus xinyiensis]
MKLYFIRHGKTEWNLESRYQGAGGDSELLPESFDEIKDLAKFLNKTTFAHAYASPIKRARITAKTILDKMDDAPRLTLLSRLKEFNLGKMEGMKFSDVAKMYPNAFENFRNHPDKYNANEINGESFEDVINRMTPAIKSISNYYSDNDNIMIVSHGAALNALINSLLGTPIAELRHRGGLANTSTTILETHDNGKTFKLLKWNYTDYLARSLNKTDLI